MFKCIALFGSFACTLFLLVPSLLADLFFLLAMAAHSVSGDVVVEWKAALVRVDGKIGTLLKELKEAKSERAHIRRMLKYSGGCACGACGGRCTGAFGRGLACPVPAARPEEFDGMAWSPCFAVTSVRCGRFRREE